MLSSELCVVGVSFEDRQDLLGHRLTRITTHYSVAEIQSLTNAANKVCDGTSSETVTLLKVCAVLPQTQKPCKY